MTTTLTLDKGDIQKAIEEYLNKKGYTNIGKIDINVGTEYMDRMETTSSPVFKNITVKAELKN